MNEINPAFFLTIIVNEEAKMLCKDYDKSENDLKALQSVGQVSGGGK